MSLYKPCPECGSQSAEKMSFTWWGGIIGPKVLSHVKCGDCGQQYNGKTGRDNTTGIVIYSIVVLAVIGFIFLLLIGLVTIMLALN